MYCACAWPTSAWTTARDSPWAKPNAWKTCCRNWRSTKPPSAIGASRKRSPSGSSLGISLFGAIRVLFLGFRHVFARFLHVLLRSAGLAGFLLRHAVFHQLMFAGDGLVVSD